MKDKKNLLILLPVLIFGLTFGLIYRLNASFAINSDTAVDAGIPSGTVYKMLRKNMYSWHLINSSFNHEDSRNASGTKLIQSTDGNDYQAVVYCAEEGKTLSDSSKRTRYSLDEMNNISSSVRENYSKVMPYMYPYISLGATSSDANTLKSVLKSADKGLGGSIYDTYHFDDLNANEAITAVQAAIWNIENGVETFGYKSTISDFEPHSYNDHTSFQMCSDYHDGKVITSEEERWYSQGGCNSSSNFYKYVYNHTKDSNTENRINALINWYISTLPTKISTEEKAKYVKVQSYEFNETAEPTGILTINFDTNLNDYDVVFKDNAKNTLGSYEDGNTYRISIESNVTSVTWSVVASNASANVYYYRADNGQDFIGLERAKYTNSGVIPIEHIPDEPDEPDPEPKKGNIVIYKTSSNTNNIKIEEQSGSNFDASKCGGTATNCLSGSKFELYYGEEKALYKLITTNYSNTSSVTFTDLPLGTYYLKETQPPHGHDLYTAGTQIQYADGTTGVIGNDKLIKIVLTDDKTYAITVNNTKTNICFTKLDVSNGGVALANAKYQIEDIDGMTVETFVTSANTGQEKYCLNGQLDSGSYFIREIEAPGGYSLDSTRYHFKLGNASGSISSLVDIGNPVEAEVVNNLITFTDRKEVEISKSDATTGVCVKDAELVVRDKNNNIVKDSNGVEIGKWRSTCECDNDPSSMSLPEDALRSCNAHKISLAPNQCYTLTENMTEELQKQGYSTGETIEFCVDENGKVKEPVDMKDAPIKVCIYKVEKGSKKPLAGASFKLYKEDGKTLYKDIVTKGDENNDCIGYVPFGTYYIKEIKAPDGYKPINEEIKIDIKDTKDTQYFYIENEVEAPKTAMDSTRLLIIISMVFMVFGIGMVGYYVIKKKS